MISDSARIDLTLGPSLANLVTDRYTILERQSVPPAHHQFTVVASLSLSLSECSLLLRVLLTLVHST